MCQDVPILVIIMNFGMWGDMADVITHAKFSVNRFCGLVWHPQICITA